MWWRSGAAFCLTVSKRCVSADWFLPVSSAEIKSADWFLLVSPENRRGGPVNRMGTERQKEGAVEGSVSNKVLTTPRDSRNVESREQIPLISVNCGQNKPSCILPIYCWPWFSPNCEAMAYPGSLITCTVLHHPSRPILTFFCPSTSVIKSPDA